MKISKQIIPMLPSLLWAVRERGLRHPVLDGIHKNIDWVDKWYVDSLWFLSERFHTHVANKFEEYGISPLRDDSSIRNWISDRRTL